MYRGSIVKLEIEKSWLTNSVRPKPGIVLKVPTKGFSFAIEPKFIYPKYSKQADYVLWHCVCAVNIKSWFKSWKRQTFPIFATYNVAPYVLSRVIQVRMDQGLVVKIRCPMRS